MATSPFSFHCMICIEEFHSELQFPVVLPCGHTYICNHCAERLDKCMECRTPLYEVQSQTHIIKAPASNSGRYSSQSGRGHSTKPPPIIKKRFPLPKNIVLLSLMEATELATTQEKNQVVRNERDTDDTVTDADAECPTKENISPKNKTQTGNLLDAVDQQAAEEEIENSKIQAGTSFAISGCGTYVVRSTEGLAIHPSRPDQTNIESEITRDGEEIDSLVRSCPFDHKVTEKGKITSIEEFSPEQLNYGDRVQIVSIINGWAKLSRGYGFVNACGNQLVKVGVSMDKSCKIEAMLHSLSVQRRCLKKEESQVDSQFNLLMKHLQTSLLNDEDFTIIGGHTNLEERNASTNHVDEKEAKKEVEEESKDDQDVDDQTKALSNLYQPLPLHRQETPQSMYSLGLACFSPDSLTVFQAVSGTQPQSTCNNLIPRTPPPAVATFERKEHPPLQEQRAPSQAVTEAGAQACRETRGREVSRGIDFRTGMSSHSGLLSSNAHAHHYLTPANIKRMMMSSHSGLSRTTRKQTLTQSSHTERSKQAPCVDALPTSPSY